MFSRNLKSTVASLIVSAWLTPVYAQVAQEPLLNRPNTVSPNLVVVLDTSGSMAADYIYEFGTIDGSGMGPQGPNNASTYGRYAPEVNRLYYDPRVRYIPRVDYLGNPLAVDAPSGSWKTYFRKTSGPYTSATLGSSTDYYTSADNLPYAVVAGSSKKYPTDTSGLPGGTLFPKFINRTDCVASTTSCSFAEERQNRENWKKWYSTRGKMAQTGMGAAFQPLADDSLRLGYGTIDGLNSNHLDRGVGSYSPLPGGVKSAFFTWLYGRAFSGGTPNLVAVDNTGKYYQRTDSDGPWSTIPNPASTGITTVGVPTGPGAAELPANHASCRRSFSMLLTDGYWNGTRPSTAGNSDNTSFSIPPPIGAPYVYTPIAPYRDNASNTLADLAMHYWGRDLRPDLANRVPVINANGINNPSFWQNVSFYGVTFGINGTLSRDAATLASLTSGATPWPTPSANQPNTIDDTWHATINARGEMLNANNADELTAGLKKMFNTIAGTPQTLSGVAVSTTYLKTGTRKFKPEYVPGTWWGKLSSIELDEVTGNEKVPANIFWQVEQGPSLTAPFDPVSTIPSAAARNIMTWNGSAGVAFTAASTGLASDLVDYLRGDPANELRKGVGSYRNREAKLGDIVNSSPAYILDNLDMKYQLLVPPLGDYAAFVASKAARPEGVLFVGANDGMLHGFRNSNGVETFAYVPKAVVPNLHKLSQSPYTHQYYVDGPNVETDAFIGGSWKNLLLGTTGAGAKAVFALDVTNPLSLGASNVLWEVSNSTAGFSELGYVFADVQAGVLESGDWVAIFGNGIGSSAGVARLFVVNLQTGALLKNISTGVGGGNGLSGVRVVRDATKRIVGAYAGDLKGNMWKFDLTGASSASWKVGLSGSALYAGGSSQPITAAPAVLPHPNGGYVVTFGTGKFVETVDTTDLSAQTLYGVWDSRPFGEVVAPLGAAPVSGLLQLQPQTITTVTLPGPPPVDYYKVSTNAVVWGDGLLTGKRGWYINLPNSGQRVVYPVERLAGTVVMATTLSPVSSVVADACVQTGSGSGWVYLIDGLTGSGPTKPTLDTNGDGVVDSSDTVVSGYQDPVDGRPTSIKKGSCEADLDNPPPCFKLECQYDIETAQSKAVPVKLLCGQPGMPPCCSTSVPGIKSREWRQLFMR